MESEIYKTIFCEECGKDIQIERTPEGVLVVLCPNCSGECMVCDCHLVKTCFSDEEKLLVRHPDKNGRVTS